MNKVIFGLILAVCVLGMALLMLNERLVRKPETQPVASAPQIVTEREIGLEPEPSASGQVAKETDQGHDEQAEMSEEMAKVAREYEDLEAKAALAPPKVPEVAVNEPQRIPEQSGNEGKRSREDMRENTEIEPIPEPSPVARPKAATEQPAKPRPPKAEVKKPEKSEQAKPARAEQPKQEAARPATAAKEANDGTITRFVVFSRENGATIRISGDKTMSYKTINLENPERIVIDIDGDWKFPPKLEVPKNALVDTVRVGKNGEKTRLVIDLKEKPRIARYLPNKKSDSLDVRVDK